MPCAHEMGEGTLCAPLPASYAPRAVVSVCAVSGGSSAAQSDLVWCALRFLCSFLLVLVLAVALRLLAIAMGCWRLARWHACSRCLLCGERNLQSGELRSAGVCSVFETVSVAVAVRAVGARAALRARAPPALAVQSEKRKKRASNKHTLKKRGLRGEGRLAVLLHSAVCRLAVGDSLRLEESPLKRKRRKNRRQENKTERDD